MTYQVQNWRVDAFESRMKSAYGKIGLDGLPLSPDSTLTTFMEEDNTYSKMSKRLAASPHVIITDEIQLRYHIVQ